MGLGKFLNAYVLARFGLCLTPVSTLQRLRDNQRTSKTLAEKKKLAEKESQLASRHKELESLWQDFVSHQQEAAGNLRDLQKRAEVLDHEKQALKQEKDGLAGQLSHLQARLAALQPTEPCGQEEFLSLARHFSPCTAVGHRKLRLGRDNDGGYVMLDDFEGITAAFSFGISDDDSWDLEIAKRGIPTYQFDHTVASAPSAHPNLTFVPSKVVGKSGEDGLTLTQLLERYGDNEDATNLLKIDIEGDEWEVFAEVEPSHLRRFAQIVCEFHDFNKAGDDTWRSCAHRVMEKLSDDFAIIHVHGNNYRPPVIVGNVPFPNVLEVTFANRARYQFTDCDEIFPTPLDQPNDPTDADLFLGNFKF